MQEWYVQWKMMKKNECSFSYAVLVLERVKHP